MQPDQADALVLALRNAARDLVERRSINDLEQALTQIVAVAACSPARSSACTTGIECWPGVWYDA